MADDDILYSEKWIFRQTKSLWDKGKSFIELSGFKNEYSRKTGLDFITNILEKHQIPYRLSNYGQKSYDIPIDIHKEIIDYMFKYSYLDVVCLGIGVEYWFKCLFLKKGFTIHKTKKSKNKILKISDNGEFLDKTIDHSILIGNIHLVMDINEDETLKLRDGLKLIAQWRNKIFHLSPLSWGESGFDWKLISWTINKLENMLKPMFEDEPKNSKIKEVHFKQVTF